MAIPRIAPYSLVTAAQLPTNKITTNNINWPIDPARAVLLVHDMQNYFVDFYQRDAEPMASLLRNINALKSACRAAGVPVIYTAQPGNQRPEDRALLTDFWGPGLADDPTLTSITPELAPAADDIQYTKWRYSAFKRTPLREFLRSESRDQLIICGVYAHIGILSTALEAFMEDIKTTVIADAVADFCLADHQMALNYIAQRCGYVDSLTSALSQLKATTTPPVMSLPLTPFPLTPLPLTMASIRADVAKILLLSPEDIDPAENLTYVGLDSIRLMSLLEQWRTQGANLEFVELAEKSTLNDWWSLIERKAASEMVAEELA